MSHSKDRLPMISIVIAVFNGAKTIQQCVDSIVNQTYPYKELIIMDGASKDATVSILERNTSQIAYWESKDDRGIAHAWNKALEHAKGDWILFLGADDHLHDPNVLSDFAEILGGDIGTDLIYGQVVYDGGINDKKIFGSEFDSRVLRWRMNIPHTACFQRKKFLQGVGQFDEDFKIAIDYEILLRKKSLSGRYVARLVSRMGGWGVSSRLTSKTLREFRAAQIKNRVTNRWQIEFMHAFYQLRHQFNIWRN